MYALILLFFLCFGAATFLPIQSEIFLISFALSDDAHPYPVLWFVATSGNVAGSLLNWFLGRSILHYKDRKWFPIRQSSLEKATTYYQRFGSWTLLLAWMPFIGDPLTFVAGIFRVNIGWFLLLVFLGKGFRYAFLLFII